MFGQLKVWAFYGLTSLHLEIFMCKSSHVDILYGELYM